MNLQDPTHLSQTEVIAVQAKLLIEQQLREQKYKAVMSDIRGIVNPMIANIPDENAAILTNLRAVYNLTKRIR